MQSTNINIKNLTQIPEKDFKQHFRDWMEQNDVARSLQAKLRKDLIANFNKTSLGKTIIAQTGASQGLNLSPLLLALNTLAAEFLYAQNCHFTLSVFCTEVPYRNTLPDFESAHHFRFSEHEISEILDALASNFDMDTKQSISKEYFKKNNSSLLFVVIKNLLSKPKKNEDEQQKRPPVEQLPPPLFEKQVPPSTEKLNSKVEFQSKNFRYLNKYLMILSKKIKEMSLNFDVLQKQNTSNAAPQAVRKSLQARKFENLNRNLEKISENLRHLSLSKRKNKRLSAVVTAVDCMAKQFEKCLVNFDQLSKGMAGNAAKCGDGLGGQKLYSDWIHEMRTTDNGKLFLEKIESSLRKTLNRERKKMETELDERMKIQKHILKTKYKHKLTEELAQVTSRNNADNSHQQTNETFEKKLDEFEIKHKELQLKIQEAEKKLTTESSTKPIQPQVFLNKVTQTTDIVPPPPDQILLNEEDQFKEIIKSISDRERQVNHIVFDAKLRVQELEHESNQLDRTFRDYLERQRLEKDKIRENTTSIWQNYALEKSRLDSKPFQPPYFNTSTKLEKHPELTLDRIPPKHLTIPKINIEDLSETSISVPIFENPFRVAKRKVLSKNRRTLSKPQSPQLPQLPLSDSDSSPKNYTRERRKQRPKVLQLIEAKDDEDEIHTKMSSMSSLSLSPIPNRSAAIPATKLTQTTQRLSPDFNLDDITYDGIELSPTTAKSSSVQSGDSNTSATRGIFKLKRQFFTSNNGAGGTSTSTSSSNTQQMNSNDDSIEPKEPLSRIKKHQSVDVDNENKSSTEGHNKDVAVNKEIMKTNLKIGAEDNKDCEVVLGKSTGDEKVVAPLETKEGDAALQSSHLNTPVVESTTLAKKDST